MRTIQEFRAHSFGNQDVQHLFQALIVVVLTVTEAFGLSKLSLFCIVQEMSLLCHLIVNSNCYEVIDNMLLYDWLLSVYVNFRVHGRTMCGGTYAGPSIFPRWLPSQPPNTPNHPSYPNLAL